MQDVRPPSDARRQDSNASPGRRSRPGPVAVALFAGLVGAIAAISVGCGSGGGSGEASGGGGFLSSAGVSPATLEVFLGSLGAIHPDTPETAISLDPSALPLDAAQNRVGPLVAIGGAVVDGTLTGAKVEWVVYPRSDGTLQRVSTDPNAGTPTPIRISSEDAVLPFCEARIALDAIDSTNARLAYGTDGVDCEGELAWRMVTLADDESTAPRDFPGRPFEPLVDPATGTHAGWLALEDGRLSRLGPALAVEQADLRVGVTRGEILGATADGTLFLELDQRLYAYDPTRRTLDDLDFEFEPQAPCPCGSRFASDGDRGLLVAGGRLYRADPVRGEVTAIATAADDDPNPFTTADDFVAVGASRIAWSYTTDVDGNPATLDDQEAVIRSVRRDGSSGITLDHYVRGDVDLPTDAPFAPTASDEWLFYNRIEQGQTFPVAMTTRLEGQQFSLGVNALWVGRSVAPVLAPAHLGPLTGLLRLGNLQDVTDIENGPTFALSLVSVEPDDPREVRLPLGYLPAGTRFAWAGDGYGPRRIGVLLASDGSGGLQTDLISWNDDQEDSLEQVTATSGTSERPAPLF